ncbi:MAG: helix-turn-helix domain-containing protein [Candidatus Methylomirabilales bacterium]
MRVARKPSAEGRGAPQPLAAASERLRGKPGRPRKDGHILGIAPAEDGVGKGQRWSALALRTIVPRLMSLGQAALYLGVSPWTVRELASKKDGVLKRVRIPLANGGELRNLLFDREDLDRLIEAWKER